MLPIPGSSAVWTFHFPFVAAAMVLGGPTAGAWVGFLATLERRELESQPWYGTLANHAVIAFGAVVGGLTVLVVRGALASTNIDPGAAGVLAIAAGTLVLAVTVNGVAAGTIILRERLAPMAVVDILVRSLGRVTLAEIVLASVFTVAYVAVGWWAPLALAVVVLLIWPGEGFEGIDPLTQLPPNTPVQARARRRARSHAARPRAGRPATRLDLVGFGRSTGTGACRSPTRSSRSRRATAGAGPPYGRVGRLGGDEFAIFFAGMWIEPRPPSGRATQSRPRSGARRDLVEGACTSGSRSAAYRAAVPELPSAACWWTGPTGRCRRRSGPSRPAAPQLGAKFSPIRRVAVLADTNSDDHPSSWRSRLPRGRSHFLELGAFVAAGTVLVATAVVLGIRLLR